MGTRSKYKRRKWARWDRTGCRNPYTSERWHETVHIFASEMSLRAISAEVGLSVNTVRSIINQARSLGIPLPIRTTAHRSSPEAAARPNIKGGGVPRTRAQTKP